MVAGLSSLRTIILELSASNWLQVLEVKHSPEQTVSYHCTGLMGRKGWGHRTEPWRWLKISKIMVLVELASTSVPIEYACN